MQFWVLLLVVLGFLWLLQAVGTYFQMAHYRKVLGGITAEADEGYVGVGNAKSYFGKGVILMLVVGEDGVVGRALRMRGRTVFARFEDADRLVGLGIDELRDGEREGPEDPGTMAAARMAVEQIDRIRAQKAGAAVS
ncbi:transcriptional regulator GutM [Rubrobacter marinus]|nr:transcriptional regulator GutM [Rubrobacter marinus]